LLKVHYQDNWQL